MHISLKDYLDLSNHSALSTVIKFDTLNTINPHDREFSNQLVAAFIRGLENFSTLIKNKLTTSELKLVRQNHHGIKPSLVLFHLHELSSAIEAYVSAQTHNPEAVIEVTQTLQSKLAITIRAAKEWISTSTPHLQ
jgi:hypothetical protein